MNRKVLLAGIATVLSGLTMTALSADVVLNGGLIGSVENIRGGGNNSDVNGTPVFVSRTRFNDESSYVRIFGLENVGGGVQAGFQIESGFDLSGGSAAGNNFNSVNSGNSKSGIATRNSGIFMQGAFGKILFGRWDVFYDTIYLIEPDRKSLPNKVSLLSLFNTPTGGNSLYFAPNNPNPNNNYFFGSDSNLGDRYNNVLSYYTPDVVGLKVQLAYVPTNESSTLGKDFNGQIYMGTLSYTPDYLPLAIVASGFQQRAKYTTTGQSPTAQVLNPPGFAQGTVLFSDYRLTALRFGAAVKLPLAEGATLQVGAVYQPSKLALRLGEHNPLSYRDTYKRQSFGFPLALMLGSNTFYLTYGHNGKLKINGDDMPDSGANFYMAGYNFDISKQTAIGVYYARLKNQSRAGYDFYGNGLNSYIFGTYGAYGGSLNNLNSFGIGYGRGINPSAAGISFRHLF